MNKIGWLLGALISGFLAYKFAGISPSAPYQGISDGTTPALFLAAVCATCVWGTFSKS